MLPRCPSSSFRLALGLLLSVAGGIPQAHGEDWPRWRGTNGDAVTAEHSGWDGRKWLIGKGWQVDVGSGLGASPAVAGSKVYVMGYEKGHDVLSCLDLASGKALWRGRYRAGKDGRFRKGESAEGPTCTPTVDVETGRIYTLGNDGDLVCWDGRGQGKRLWGLNLYDRFEVDARRSSAKTDPRRDYGYCGNVLLVDDVAVVEVGDQDTGNIVGFDKQTGRVKWTSEDRHDAGHSCGPVLMSVGDRDCIVSFTLEGLRIMEASGDRAGRNVAWYPWVMPFNVNLPTPAVSGDVVVLTGTDDYHSGRGTTFLRIGARGVTQRWRGARQAYVCSPVIHEGHVYLVDGRVSCMRLRDGKLVWEGGRFRGSAGSLLVTGDNRLIVWAGGELVLVETASRSPDRYVELARLRPFRRADHRSYPHVTLADGWLLAKDGHGRLKGIKVETPGR